MPGLVRPAGRYRRQVINDRRPLLIARPPVIVVRCEDEVQQGAIVGSRTVPALRPRAILVAPCSDYAEPEYRPIITSAPAKLSQVLRPSPVLVTPYRDNAEPEYRPIITTAPAKFLPVAAGACRFRVLVADIDYSDPLRAIITSRRAVDLGATLEALLVKASGVADNIEARPVLDNIAASGTGDEVTAWPTL